MSIQEKYDGIIILIHYFYTLYADFSKKPSPALFNLSDFISFSGFIRNEWTKSSSKDVSNVDLIIQMELMRTKNSQKLCFILMKTNCKLEFSHNLVLFNVQLWH